MPRRLILRHFLSPGDLVMLTAAVRDLHQTYPGLFLTDVRSPCPQLWAHNPYLTPLDESSPGVEVLDCHYPIIHSSNQRPYHFVFGFTEFLSDRLRLQLKPTAFGGDLHLSAEERAAPPQVPGPYWLLVAGGKYDYTTKWWATERYQAVVDAFAGRITFVQVGEIGHYHPRLSGVVDLRGKTDLRQLVLLVYHAQGVLCPVTLAMHLAAAVPLPPGRTGHRPCVVVAGGREPPHWVAYPAHQFLHRVGALACCADGGCWKSRAVPLGDGDPKDRELCVDLVGTLPRCLHLVTVDDVTRAIGLYFEGGALPPLQPLRG